MELLPLLLHSKTTNPIRRVVSKSSQQVMIRCWIGAKVDMKNERERKEQESKMNQMLDLVSAGAHPGTVFALQKPNIPIPGVPALATSGLPSIPTEIAARDGRPNKKSKWDKVDGDVKNPPALAAGTNAALVSGASAGSGYSAFANQRRREVEGRRSAERKLEGRT